MAKGQVAPQRDIFADNLNARNIVLSRAIEMTQAIYASTLSGTIPGQVLNIPVRNVGLIKRFIVEIEFGLAQSAAETLTRSKHGAANILSNVVLTDFSNQQRVNTSGWHLNMLATARRQSAFGAAFTNDSTSGVGSNVPVINAPSAITAVQTVRGFYEVPVAYGDMDLRGSMWANVINATANLQLTVNPNLVVASTGSDVLAAYKSSTAALGTITSFKVKVYQVYLDQIPYAGNGAPILPVMDISTVYDLKNTVITGLSVNNDNAVPYANFRQFLSTCFIFDQQGTLNKATDINAVRLQAANFSNIMDVDPYLLALMTRNEIGDDFPDGTYYVNHRRRPIDTQTYGNMQLIVNPSSVAGAASQLLVGFEALSMQNIVSQAGSLPSN